MTTPLSPKPDGEPGPEVDPNPGYVDELRRTLDNIERVARQSRERSRRHGVLEQMVTDAGLNARELFPVRLP
ncbi:hypothetical protein SLNSH_17015 [Alsobacter soli]|uniref:Uncharacterized protein n=1 Tax=Alsobacter soli TaxID=2109933 RepID=A0A2T1HQ81_9HYPH|nr:hypothetical protein [Alsobacter soli]PSC03810.1 hypothetical protein SLNSH_17015 [Alsobacter soli]